MEYILNFPTKSNPNSYHKRVETAYKLSFYAFAEKMPRSDPENNGSYRSCKPKNENPIQHRLGASVCFMFPAYRSLAWWEGHFRLRSPAPPPPPTLSDILPTLAAKASSWISVPPPIRVSHRCGLHRIVVVKRKPHVLLRPSAVCAHAPPPRVSP